jgi:SNF2 family DNA or RNA helicase
MIHWQYGLLVSELVIIPSIQVGTVGLNLTAATHVIHFDRQYNPAKENQAGPMGQDL